MRQVPRALAAVAVAATTIIAAPAAAQAAGHLIAPGETLSGIAAANGLSTSAVAAANGLTPESFVISGRTLTIPAPGSSSPAAAAPATASAAPASGGHLIQPGETLSGIAAANGVSPATLAAANGLTPTSLVISGHTLAIPSAGAAAPAATTAPATAPSASAGGHLVVPGETLSGIAAANGISPGALAAVNGLTPTSFVISGSHLQIPGVSSSAVTGSPSASSGAAPAATPVRVSGSQIGQIASQNGVSPSLAQAVAWQESGFNNGVLSSANARGVMQIIPSTWRYIQSNLSSSPLDPQSATDNVRAGSLYLGHLLQRTGGDPTLAIAGYYQGLASVRRIGLLPETQRYVDNVLALRQRFGG